MSLRVKLPDSANPDPEMVLWAGGSQRLAALLQGRGINARADVEHLLNPLARPEPDLSQYPPLVKAVQRINAAVDKGEQIAIYGDYDVDGITATTVLVSALSRLNAQVIWHIPNRFSEGYGMNPQRVEALAGEGTSLIITCDCGISNHGEIDLAARLGADVIITDHHTPPEVLPSAFCVLNFKLLPQGHPSRDLPGAGTAFILARALLAQHGQEADDLLDLVALGIIADVVPLTGHCRQLYALGLPVMKKAERPGLAALLSVAGVQPELVDEEKLGFQVAPRINAAGRLDDGAAAVRLFLAGNQELATVLARELDQLNSLRKELGRSIMADLNSEPGQAVVAYNPDWHQGVIGIAAGQICSGNQAPAILMTNSRQGGGIVGSARSVEGINIYDVLMRCQDHLDKFGGHPAAAGFSLRPENLENFQIAVRQVLAKEMAAWTAPELRVDLVLSPGDINLELVEELNRLAPCGEGNPRPLLYCQGMSLKSVRPAGGGHILTLGDHRRSFSAGLWDGRPAPEPGGSIGAVFSVSEDAYRGQRSVWATLEAWWPGTERPHLAVQGYEYEDLRRQPWPQVLKKYPGAGIYREGIQWQDFPGCTRNNLEPGDTLVLLTPPSSQGILRQILAMSEPSLIVLGYSAQAKRSFQTDFMGAVKYILNQLAGLASLPGLAAALGHNEETVLAAFRLLAVSGILDFQLSQGKVILQKLKGTTLKPGPQADKLRLLIQETWAFQDWLLKADLTEIKKIKP